MPNRLLCVVAAALRDGTGRVLVQQRPLGKHHAGLWEFPGGKVEADEGPQAALVRELAEELGLSVAAEDLQPLGFSSEESVSGRALVLLLYGCDTWSGTAQPLEAAGMAWVEPADLGQWPMPPLDVALLPVLQSASSRA